MGRIGPVEGDPKEIVRAGYDACAERYNATRGPDGVAELNTLIEFLPADAEVLDIGCGGGHPVSMTLARHASITGVDISATQIGHARESLPGAHLIVGDITSGIAAVRVALVGTSLPFAGVLPS